MDKAGRYCVSAYIFILCCSLVVGCASTSRALTRSKRSYSDIGGASLGSPSSRDGRVHVPITLDKDGDAFWHRESASFIQNIDVSHTGRQIQFSVVTALEEPRKPVKREIVVEKLDPGTYSVVYEDPDGTLHPVGEFTIKKALN